MAREHFPQYRCLAAPAEKKDGIVVIGAGGHAKVLISTLTACGVSGTAAVDDDTQMGHGAQGTPNESSAAAGSSASGTMRNAGRWREP